MPCGTLRIAKPLGIIQWMNKTISNILKESPIHIKKTSNLFLNLTIHCYEKQKHL